MKQGIYLYGHPTVRSWRRADEYESLKQRSPSSSVTHNDWGLVKYESSSLVRILREPSRPVATVSTTAAPVLYAVDVEQTHTERDKEYYEKNYTSDNELDVPSTGGRRL
jgi:hypothetical protein